MPEYDSLFFRQFTAKSEADKAINSLRGLLLGISLDGVINDKEIGELNKWCTTHFKLINRNPFKEFMLTILEAINETSNRKELIEDLIWLCQKYETDSYYYDVATVDLQTLQGICHGILADGVIDDEEVIALDRWLQENTHLATYYPYDEIRSLIVSVLSDGKIDDDERKRLMAYFNEFVKLTDSELAKQIKNEIKDVTINGICTADPNINFKGNTFCFTGISKRAKRSDIEKQIKDLGGIFNNNLTKNTDYLIVGNCENPCWAFACYGRKVETAVSLRKQGAKIALIHEFDFWDSVEDER